MRYPQPVQQPFQGSPVAGLHSGTGAADRQRRVPLDLYDAIEVQGVEAGRVGGVAQQALRYEQVDAALPQEFHIHGAPADEMLDPAPHLAGAVVVGAEGV